jgi:hypothetical protein
LKRFENKWESIHLMGGFVQDKDEQSSKCMDLFTSNLKGQMLTGAIDKARFDKKVSRMLEEDRLIYPDWTYEKAKRMVREWDTAILNKDDILGGSGSGNGKDGSVDRSQKVNAAKAKAKETHKSAEEKKIVDIVNAVLVHAAEAKTTTTGGKAKPKTVFTSKRCQFCDMPDGEHWTSDCPTLTDIQKKAFEKQRLARQKTNSGKKDSGK